MTKFGSSDEDDGDDARNRPRVNFNAYLLRDVNMVDGSGFISEPPKANLPASSFSKVKFAFAKDSDDDEEELPLRMDPKGSSVLETLPGPTSSSSSFVPDPPNPKPRFESKLTAGDFLYNSNSFNAAQDPASEGEEVQEPSQEQDEPPQKKSRTVSDTPPETVNVTNNNTSAYLRTPGGGFYSLCFEYQHQHQYQNQNQYQYQPLPLQHVRLNATESWIFRNGDPMPTMLGHHHKIHSFVHDRQTKAKGLVRGGTSGKWLLMYHGSESDKYAQKDWENLDAPFRGGLFSDTMKIDGKMSSVICLYVKDHYDTVEVMRVLLALRDHLHIRKRLDFKTDEATLSTTYEDTWTKYHSPKLPSPELKAVAEADPATETVKLILNYKPVKKCSRIEGKLVAIRVAIPSSRLPHTAPVSQQHSCGCCASASAQTREEHTLSLSLSRSTSSSSSSSSTLTFPPPRPLVDLYPHNGNDHPASPACSVDNVGTVYYAQTESVHENDCQYFTKWIGNDLVHYKHQFEK